MSLSPSQLQYRINTVVDYMQAFWGLPEVTAKTSVLNIIGTLASSGAHVDWRGGRMAPRMVLVVSPGVVTENRGYADFLSYPLEQESERLRERFCDEANFLTKQASLEKTLESMSDDDPRYHKLYSEYLEFWESGSPFISLRTLPKTNGRAPLGATVVIDDTGNVLREALAQGTDEALTLLEKGYKPEQGRRRIYGTILEAPPEMFGKLLSRVDSDSWQPIILPSAASFISRNSLPGQEKIRQLWSEVVDEALRIRRTSMRLFTVSNYGDAAINRVIELAAIKSRASRFRGKFLWVASATVKFAAIFHLLRGVQGDEIDPEAWESAERHVGELINVHAATAVPTKQRGRAIDGRPTDLRTLHDRIRDNPTSQFRDLCRGLPKRRPGYWKALSAEVPLT